MIWDPAACGWSHFVLLYGTHEHFITPFQFYTSLLASFRYGYPPWFLSFSLAYLLRPLSRRSRLVDALHFEPHIADDACCTVTVNTHEAPLMSRPNFAMFFESRYQQFDKKREVYEDDEFVVSFDDLFERKRAQNAKESNAKPGPDPQ